MRLSIVALALATVAALPVPKASFLRGAREYPCQIRHRRDSLDVGMTISPLSSPDLAPQGHAGNDDLTATGDDNELKVCPASALTTAVDLVSFAGQRGQRQADRDGLRPCPRRRPVAGHQQVHAQRGPTDI